MTINDDIRALLADQCRVPRDSVAINTRLAEDLGLGGRGAVEFFSRLADRHRVDLTALWQGWDEYFDPDDTARRFGLMLLTIFVIGVAGPQLGDFLNLSRGQELVLVLGLFIAAWAIINRKRRRAARTIRVSDVVAAVERGRWE
ncbi:MAG: hypothetical protein CMN73_14455 [Sphingomonas sp.]|nr:hypothetical protein [Sphingomonas sp.]